MIIDNYSWPSINLNKSHTFVAMFTCVPVLEWRKTIILAGGPWERKVTSQNLSVLLIKNILEILLSAIKTRHFLCVVFKKKIPCLLPQQDICSDCNPWALRKFLFHVQYGGCNVTFNVKKFDSHWHTPGGHECNGKHYPREHSKFIDRSTHRHRVWIMYQFWINPVIPTKIKHFLWKKSKNLTLSTIFAYSRLHMLKWTTHVKYTYI